MPFFSKAIQDITTADLAELLATSAVETVRLEFKREIPGPDDMLKKLSGFANTFGGYLIVGAAGHSSSGRLESFPGVELQRNFKQTVIQRCHEGIWPPIDVAVSEGIAAPESSDRFCYVVYAPESLATPHFLNKGRGAWVRTDEYSQRFETRLANYEQLLHLNHRRTIAVDRRDRLFDRAVDRFDALASLDYSSSGTRSGGLGANMSLGICPAFPTAKLQTEHDLHAMTPRCTVPWRSIAFPRGDVITQVDSVLNLQPSDVFSIVEVSTWGQVFYACEIEHLAGDGADNRISGIHLHAFLGHVLVVLEHARSIYRSLGYSGPLMLRCKLRRIRGKRFMSFPRGNVPSLGPSSKLDDELDVGLSLAADRLETARDDVARDLFKLLFFGMNWAARARDARVLDDLLGMARTYNFWST